jgi:large subunit ribosomal protein L30
MPEKIIIKQIQSRISTKPGQKATLTALGLRRMNSEKIHDNNPVIRGMIDKVKHLVEVKSFKK